MGVPYHYPIAGEATVDHCVGVADAVSISAYIYYFPARVENTLELDTLDRFASTERIVDVEEPSGDVGRV